MAAFRAMKQFVNAVSGTAFAAINTDVPIFPKLGNGHSRQVLIWAKGADMVVKFGFDNTVLADNTVTAGALADGNFVVPAGSLQVFDLEKDDQYYSAKSLDGASTGTLYVALGNGEGKSHT